MENNIVFIGVDPGLTGGVAVIYPDKTEVITMPLKNGEIDIQKIIEWSIYPNLEKEIIASVEKVWAISRGKMAVASLNFSAGIIQGILESFGVPVTRVAPATWRKAVLNYYRASKQEAIDFCYKQYPTVKIDRNHNLAEALCIAHYGKITWKG